MLLKTTYATAAYIFNNTKVGRGTGKKEEKKPDFHFLPS